MLLDSPPKVFHVKSDNCEWSKIQLKIYFKSHKQCLSTCLIKKTRTEIVMSWYTKNLKHFFYFKWIISTPRYLTNFILFWVSLTWRKHQVKQQHGGRQKLNIRVFDENICIRSVGDRVYLTSESAPASTMWFVPPSQLIAVVANLNKYLIIRNITFYFLSHL